MLYLVCGVSRSGKTMTARNVLRRRKIACVSLDWLVMGFTNGMPDCGIHDKLYPNEIAEKMWQFVEAMCENILWSQEDVIIEGEAISPSSVRTLLDKHPACIRASFLGYSSIPVEQKVEQVKQFSQGDRDWLVSESEDYVHRHIANMVSYSQEIRDECEKQKLDYFDTSDDFLGAVERATKHLLQE